MRTCAEYFSSVVQNFPVTDIYITSDVAAVKIRFIDHEEHPTVAGGSCVEVLFENSSRFVVPVYNDDTNAPNQVFGAIKVRYGRWLL